MHFMSWLHLNWGVSMEKCWTARNMLVKVISKAQTTPKDLSVQSIFPKEINTVLSNHLNIKLRKQFWCPQCFTLYTPPDLPDNCTYRKTTRAKPCNTPLFKHKKLFSGSSHQGKFQETRSWLRRTQFAEINTLCCVFATQSLKLWIS
jgi:hypothetical protein